MRDHSVQLAEIRSRIEIAKADWDNHSNNAWTGKVLGAMSYLLTRSSGRFGRAAGNIGGIGGWLYGSSQSGQAQVADRKMESELDLALNLVEQACKRASKSPAEIQQAVWMHNMALERALDALKSHPRTMLTEGAVNSVISPDRGHKVVRFLQYNQALGNVAPSLPMASTGVMAIDKFRGKIDRKDLSREIHISWAVLATSIMLSFVSGFGFLIGIGWYLGHLYHGILPITRSVREKVAEFNGQLSSCGPIRQA